MFCVDVICNERGGNLVGHTIRWNAGAFSGRDICCTIALHILLNPCGGILCSGYIGFGSAIVSDDFLDGFLHIFRRPGDICFYLSGQVGGRIVCRYLRHIGRVGVDDVGLEDLSCLVLDALIALRGVYHDIARPIAIILAT